MVMDIIFCDSHGIIFMNYLANEKTNRLKVTSQQNAHKKEEKSALALRPCTISQVIDCGL